MALNHCSIWLMFNSHYQKGTMALILWQYLKMASFSESINTFLTVNENCLKRSIELRRDCYYTDADSSVFEMLLSHFLLYFKALSVNKLPKCLC